MTAETDKDQRDLQRDGIQNNPPSRRLVTVIENGLDSRDLFSGARELTITHGSDVYRLRLTSQNKLILTK